MPHSRGGRAGGQAGSAPGHRDFDQQMLVGIADHTRHTRQGGDFRGGALGIASGDHDAAGGIFTVDAANRRPGVLIGGRCHRTRIQHDDVGESRCRHGVQTVFTQLLLNGGTIRLSRPAAKILNVETSHASIVT